MIVNMDLTFSVNNEVAIIVSLIDLGAHVDAELKNANMTVHLNSLKLD